MPKGITPVIAIILLLLITIAIVGFAFMFFQRTTETAAASGEQQLSNMLSQMASRPRIEGAAGDTVYVRNTGSTDLSKGSLGFFADGQQKKIISGNDVIKPNEVGTYVLSGFDAQAVSKLKVTSGGFSDSITNPDAGAGTLSTTTATTATATTTATTATATTTATTATATTTATTATATTTIAAFKRVFLSSATYNGNLGGLAGADSQCVSLAAAANLGGAWKAWLSTSTEDARDRIPDAEYRLVDGTTVVANSKSDLISGLLKNIIFKTENGDAPTTGGVWTGTTFNGEDSGANCGGWLYSSTSSSIYMGTVGYADQVDNRWTYGAITTCSDSLRLYCFEI